jgi:hypothetical protein
MADDVGVYPGKLTPDIIQALAGQLEKYDPNRWRKCYPKIYSDVRGSNNYYSPKLPALQMMEVCHRVEHGYLGTTEEAEIAWASCLVEKQVPTYWIGKDMALAIRETVPPMELDWHNMKLPFEDAVFMLPKGVLCHPDSNEGDIPFISYSRGQKGRYTNNLSLVGPRVLGFGGNFTTYASTFPGGHFLHFNIPFEYYPTIKLGEIDRIIQEYATGHYEHRSGYTYSPHMTTDDHLLLIKVTHMVFGILLFMLRRKDLVTESKLIKKIPGKNPNDPAREFWSPGILGEHYRIRREVTATQGGTHASPRAHWCRGHWKDQHYGQGHSLIKEIWIEPYLRGIDSEE